MKTPSWLLLFFLVLWVGAPSLFAQRYEITPYAGGFFPITLDEIGRFSNEGIYGLRGGMFVTPHLEFGVNVAYMNHFDLKGNNPTVIAMSSLGFTRPAIRAVPWEGTASYNFGSTHVSSLRFRPFVIAGLGGVTTLVHTDGSTPSQVVSATTAIITANNSTLQTGPRETPVVFTSSLTQTPPNAAVFATTNGSPGATLLMDGTTSFAVSYGAGFKMLRLVGPVGFEAQLLGRTLPRFLGRTMTWTEATAGVTISWGE